MPRASTKRRQHPEREGNLCTRLSKSSLQLSSTIVQHGTRLAEHEDQKSVNNLRCSAQLLPEWNRKQLWLTLWLLREVVPSWRVGVVCEVLWLVSVWTLIREFSKCQ